MCKKQGFRDTTAIKQQRRLMILSNLTIVCSYPYSCLNVPVELVDCHMVGCASLFHHICQGGYVAMHEIDIDIAERKLSCDCVDDIQIGGKPDKLMKVGHITM